MSGFTDLAETLKKSRIIFFFAKSDTQARYKRSILGPFWLTLGTLIGVLGLGIVWSQILNIKSEDFIPNLTIGLVCWQLISNCIAESPSVFMRYASIIKNSPQPFSFYPALLVSRHIINFAHNFLVIIIVMIYYSIEVNVNTILVIPALLIVFINLFFISIILGFVGARYRDLEPTITAFLPLLFFITPILYKPTQIKVASWVIDYNPFAYYVTIVRDLLLGKIPEDNFILGFGVVTVITMTLGFILLNYKRKNITFWL
ncbi:ABC transporter permease [Duffyella gerundensis]|uniref:ABC transporter permease n=1 Tax=Duffyella gerundensis TaxID=1619313 RepID=UPI001AE135CA|nr:ABC transporter permease [Duffyella gerundensis]QTO55348.1 ABC transporter permease [Duffyella gerundensis]